PAQSRFASGRVLSRNEAEPGREVTSPPKGDHRWRKSVDRCGGDEADPPHGLQTDRRLVGPAELPKALVELADLDIKARNMIEVSLPESPHQRMDRIFSKGSRKDLHFG